MGAKRISKHNAIVDYRLVLELVAGNVRAVLTRIDRPDEAEITSLIQPDWILIRNHQEILKEPEKYGTSSLIPLGAELGAVAFPPPILAAVLPDLRRHSVRIWLRLDETLRDLPWEACYLNKKTGLAEGFLTHHPGTHLVREVDNVAEESKSRNGNARVLIAWANPGSPQYPHLPGLEREVNSVRRALDAPECRKCEIRELEYATPSSLLRYLREWPPDIFHFVGHAERTPTGCALVLESGETDAELLIYGDDLAAALATAQVQVAVMSGCNTGVASSGIGEELVAKGIPSVVAMQAPIGDASAGQFARAFYATLAESGSVEEALHQGRSAILGMGAAWVVPVLFQGAGAAFSIGVVTADDRGSVDLQRRHNLTIDERPFIGRSLELAEIKERLLVKQQRLVTISGMGGMGKTRLAVQAAVELLDEFPDGVWMVECDSFESRQDLLGAIAAAVGVEISRSDTESDLGEELRSRRMLLYLDCFEHMTPHADVLDKLLDQAPGCQMLVTSRVVLELRREYEFRLNPMTLSKKPTQGGDSVTLFAEAAGHALNSFEVDAKNRAVVRALCSELEGVPLALVLAAGRLRHLSLTELLEQVRTKPLDVLKRKGSLKDRHATIERVVDDSFRLLGRDERLLLDKLSLFVGGFTAEVAGEVCDIPKEEMVAGLSVLRDNSLLQIQMVQDRTRFKLLDTVREYIVKLARDDDMQTEREACASRHAELFCKVADTIGQLMAEGRWSEGTACLWAEVGNLRAAGSYCARENRHELVRRLCDGVSRYYFETGLYEDFEKLASAGYAAAEALGDDALTIRLFGLEGAVAALGKDKEKCLAIWKKRLELCEHVNDARGSADTLSDLACEVALLGQVDRAQEYLAKGLEIAERVGSFGLIASFLVQKAQFSLKANDVERAKFWTDEAEQAVIQSKEMDLLPYVFQNLSTLYQAFGDLKRARRNALQYMRLALGGHRYRQISWALLFVGDIDERNGEFDRAARCLLTSLKLNREFSTRHAEITKSAWTQFTKRHHDQANRLASEHKKTKWQDLIAGLSNPSPIFPEMGEGQG